MAKTGQLLPDDLVWKEGLSDWKPARRIIGLFGAGVKARTTTQASQQVAATPTKAPSPGPNAHAKAFFDKAVTAASNLTTRIQQASQAAAQPNPPAAPENAHPAPQQIACPFCRQPISNDPTLAGQLVACPHCNRQFAMPAAAMPSTLPVTSSFPQQTSVASRQATKANKFKRMYVLAGGLGFLAVCLVCAGLGHVEKRGSSPMSLNTASYVAQEIVTRRLKAPSTAKFVDNQAIERRGPYYIFYIQVDAQNPFGAMLRQGYLVFFRGEKDGVVTRSASGVAGESGTAIWSQATTKECSGGRANMLVLAGEVVAFKREVPWPRDIPESDGFDIFSPKKQGPDKQAKVVKPKGDAGPKPPTDDIWEDTGGHYWSNSRIPLLHGVPETIRRNLPEHQRKMVEATEANLAFALAEFQGVKNQFSLTQLTQQLAEKNREANEAVLAVLVENHTRGPVRWVGRIRVDSDTITLSFGNASKCVTHGGDYPYAKDKYGAFRSYRLGAVAMSLENATPAVKKAIASLRDGQWVAVEAELNLGNVTNVTKRYQDALVNVYVPASYEKWQDDSVVHVQEATRAFEFVLPTGENSLKVISVTPIVMQGE